MTSNRSFNKPKINFHFLSSQLVVTKISRKRIIPLFLYEKNSPIYIYVFPMLDNFSLVYFLSLSDNFVQWTSRHGDISQSFGYT